METDNRRRPNGIPDKHRHENHTYVHQYPVRRNAVFARVFQKLYVHHHADNAHGCAVDEFRNAVGRGFYERLSVEPRFAEAQDAAVFAEEIEQRNAAADDLPERGRDRRAGYADPRSSHDRIS